MDENQEKKKTNIIPYPNLVKRLIEKAMDALKDKRSKEAYELFQEAAQYEPDHPQVRFGEVLCLVELGRLEEAVEQTTSLLKEGIGDYYDNLQVHISLLVQLGRYEEVVELLDVVLAENRLPKEHAESLYQLLHFSRQMINDDALTFTGRDVTDLVDDKTLLMLKSEHVRIQWQAIHVLKEIDDPGVINAFVEYVENDSHDLLLRSIVLESLHKLGVSKQVLIKKLGMEMPIVPKDLTPVFDQAYANEILTYISDFLEQDNPNLLEMTTQLCWSHIYAIYPFRPEPFDPKLWATVFYIAVSNRMGMEISEEWVAVMTGLELEDLDEFVHIVEEVEHLTFQSIDSFENS
ncbi:tetratricopeptide repeat protein [Alkalihalobacillus pseudalcaliphilus]|uniref:tetratricopeptide repeat protein n=1 Tax=Alkalihalobacillus pseudalcaliphilus TaxID=79884 RepID=UPI00064DE002|nr:tetratricopeptide repeat protein [Alkalihalobacillus pseudalcaliphilus]KMK74629.1 hypothetical protein AB990_19220 [Alkalihalobacillus pseudalcaliphilus]